MYVATATTNNEIPDWYFFFVWRKKFMNFFLSLLCDKKLTKFMIFFWMSSLKFHSAIKRRYRWRKKLTESCNSAKQLDGSQYTKNEESFLLRHEPQWIWTKGKKYNLWLWGNSQLTSREKENFERRSCANKRRAGGVGGKRMKEYREKEGIEKIGLIFAIHIHTQYSLLCVLMVSRILKPRIYTLLIAIRCSL